VTPGSNAAEIVVAAKDRRGLFADLALAISSLGGNVVGARVFTSRQGQALDVFHVQDVTGAPLGCENPRALRRLADALEAAGRGETLASSRVAAPNCPARPPSRSPPAWCSTTRPPTTPPWSRPRAATVPACCTPWPRPWPSNGLSIQSAHIDGYGERAVDAFYVQTAEGGKVTETRKVTALKADLLAALEAERRPTAPADRAAGLKPGAGQRGAVAVFQCCRSSSGSRCVARNCR
jgi:[protein-PII] uridylyltransferase